MLEGRAYMRHETQNTHAGELADGERVEESVARDLKNTVNGLKNTECRRNDGMMEAKEGFDLDVQ